LSDRVRLVEAVGWVLTVLPVLLLVWTLEGLLASLLWIGFVGGSRLIIRGQAPWNRLIATGLVMVVCLVGFLAGGLYWVPATAAFVAADWLGQR